MTTACTKQKEKKKAEKQYVEMARRVCSLLPPGDDEAFEEPDLKITMGAKLHGVEVTCLLRLPTDGELYLPVETENFHKRVICRAEDLYRASGATPVDVHAYFMDEERCRTQNPDGWRHLVSDNKRGSKLENIARSLAEFVKARYRPGSESVVFGALSELPLGF